MSQVRVRFAPSPTGHLHIGSVRTALYNWLFARRYGGAFILRIEDTDRERSTEAYTEAILEAMRWMGLDWDEGPDIGGPHAPYFQTQRFDIYRAHVERLLAEGKAYRCYATTEELEALREAAQKRGEVYQYDRRWRDKGPADWPADRPYSVRFKAPLAGELLVEDLVKGRVVFDVGQHVDDFVIARSDGTPTYNFTVVVDDVTMEITHVVRGDDHLNNTPKQILLYQALGYPVPAFAHLPMTLGKDKARLSKRHGATSVEAFRDMGFLPHALINYLVRLSWSHGDEEIFSVKQLVELFSLEAVGKSAGIFDMDKLMWVNQHYLTHDPPEDIARALVPFLARLGIETQPDERLVGVVKLLCIRSQTLVEMAEKAKLFFIDEFDYAPEADAKFLVAENKPLLDALVAELQKAEPFAHAAIQAAFETVLARFELKLGKLAQPVRVAITGSTASPGIFETLELVGKDSTLKRLNRALERIAKKSE
ncbi:MAG: glutamate--tRNA ligase [Myxococcales bacterium]|nr:MAG: glutamate--tRNA ligase [Myxococcales bacterium]